MIAAVSLPHFVTPIPLPVRQSAEQRPRTDAIVSVGAQPVSRERHEPREELTWQSHKAGIREESATYPDPRVQEREKLQQALENKQQRQQTLEIQSLAQRDREVRAHEQAHVAAGGQYAGAASYQFKRGPNGVNYAVSGEVPISTGKEATPEETLRKAQTVRRAALAPAEPSAQDRKVAALASRLEAEARLELVLEQQELVKQDAEQRARARDDLPSHNHSADPLRSSVGADSVAGNHQRRDDHAAESGHTPRRTVELATFRALSQHQQSGRFYEKA